VGLCRGFVPLGAAAVGLVLSCALAASRTAAVPLANTSGRLATTSYQSDQAAVLMPTSDATLSTWSESTQN
jgi:hypothetical protein